MDFGSLNIHALRKYGQAFNLNLKSRSSKEELVMAASHHFSNQMVDEVDTIARFLYTVHSNRGKQNDKQNRCIFFKLAFVINFSSVW